MFGRFVRGLILCMKIFWFVMVFYYYKVKKKNYGGFKKFLCYNGCIIVYGCFLEFVWYFYIFWLFKECLF